MRSSLSIGAASWGRGKLVNSPLFEKGTTIPMSGAECAIAESRATTPGGRIVSALTSSTSVSRTCESARLTVATKPRLASLTSRSISPRTGHFAQRLRKACVGRAIVDREDGQRQVGRCLKPQRGEAGFGSRYAVVIDGYDDGNRPVIRIPSLAGSVVRWRSRATAMTDCVTECRVVATVIAAGALAEAIAKFAA